MPVEFELEFNVETSNRSRYQEFIENLRRRLGERSTHNRPALAIQEPNPPNPRTVRLFDLVLQTNQHAVRFRLRITNLYLIGYQMENGQWWEFNNRRNQHLITERGVEFLGFTGRHGALRTAAHLSANEINVGVHNLIYGVNRLAVATRQEGPDRAHYLIVVIMMICEAARLIPVFNYMADSFTNRAGTTRRTEGVIQDWIVDIVTSWDPLSAAFFRADAYPDEPFQQFEDNNIRIPPNNDPIRTIVQAAQVLGIALGLCFRGPRVPRMVHDEGQCFLGIPLVEVFSVRINDIDGEDPGELYGTITINNGLHTRYIYNRDRDNYESIKPGQNATLTGLNEPVSAFGNITIKLLLIDMDTVSYDDVIVNQDISWDAGEIGNVYDKVISKKLDSSNGSVTVNYAVLRNAAAATIIVTLKEGGEDTNQVYGHVSASYGNLVDPEATCLLFERTSKNYLDVNRWQGIPLLRSVVAVPLSDSLKINALLYDHDTISADDVIANGTAEFPVPETLPATTSKEINGEDGNCIQVTINWSSGF